MIKTPLTIPARAIGCLGSMMVLLGVFLPWLTIKGNFFGIAESGTLTGWQAVRITDVNPDARLFGLMFVGVYILILIGIIVLVCSVIGRSIISSGVTVVIMTITYIIMLTGLVSFVEGMIPEEAVEDVECTTCECKALYNLLEDDTCPGCERVPLCEQVFANKKQQLQKMGIYGYGDDETSITVLYGLYVCTFGGVVVCAGGVLLKIDKKRREKLLKEQEFHKKSLEAYKRALHQAYLDGVITEDERALLEVQRTALDITMEEHELLKRQVIGYGKDELIEYFPFSRAARKRERKPEGELEEPVERPPEGEKEEEDWLGL